MPDEDKNVPTESATEEAAGSSAENLIQPGPSANNPEGEPAASESAKETENSQEETVSKKEYENAQKLIGKQGEELGNMRNFFKEISPLLDKLQDSPVIVEAIMEDKLDAQLAQAVLEGKVNLSDATQVAEAHEEVKKDMGNKEYEKASPEDIEKLVAQKLDEALTKHSEKFEKGLSAVEERRSYENSVNKFIAETPDFAQYAEQIAKWFEDNPTQYDPKVAYEAVKGREVIAQARKDAQTQAAEEAKRLAAPGGQSQGSGEFGDRDMFGELVAGKGNPNLL